MKNDMDGFKRTGSDAKTMTLRHPKGHEIKVATNALSKAMRDKLMSLPQHFVDGGQVAPAGAAPADNMVMSQGPQQPGPQPIVINVGPQGPAIQPQQGPVVPQQPLQIAPEQYAMAERLAALQPQNQRTANFDPASDEGQQQIQDQSQDYVYNNALDQRENQMAKAEQQKAQAQKVMERYQHGVERAQQLGMPAPPVTQAVSNAQSLLSKELSQSTGGGAQSLSDPARPGLQSGLTPQQQVQQQADMTGSSTTEKYLTQGIGMQQAGLFGEAKAAGDLGKAQAGIYDQERAALSDVNKRREVNLAKYRAESDAFMKDYADGHVDPNRYMGSLSTREKFQTTIGLILGGMGGGLLHQENAALKYLNQLIDRDVDAQKFSMDKKMNLYKANLQRFGTEDAATSATVAQLKDIFAVDLNKAAANAQGPLQAARAQAASGKLIAENAATFGSIAAKKAIQQSMQSTPGGQQADPSSTIRQQRMAGLISETQENKMHEQLGEAQKLVKVRDNVLSAFEQIAKINTPSNWAANPVQTRSQIDAIKGPVVAGLSKETAGRFTEQDASLLDSAFSGKFDNEKTIDLKRNRIEHLISEKMNFPQLDAYRIPWRGGQRFGEGGKKTIQLGPPKI